MYKELLSNTLFWNLGTRLHRKFYFQNKYHCSCNQPVIIVIRMPVVKHTKRVLTDCYLVKRLIRVGNLVLIDRIMFT